MSGVVIIMEHIHHAGCGCAEEAKKTDPNGYDLYPHIDLTQVDCFNERVNGQIKSVIRPHSEKMDFSKGVT